MVLKGIAVLYLAMIPLLVSSCMSCNMAKTVGPQPQPEPQPQPTACETRATWIFASSIDTETKRNSVLQKLADANLNTVFVSIPRVTIHFGYGDHDDFLAFIRAAQDAGLSVHAWMTNGWRKGRKVESDFRLDSEQAFQVQWVADILDLYGQYLDGIHLDYIRYLIPEPANTGGKMDGVTTAVRKMREYLQANAPDMFFTAAVKRLDPRPGESYQDPPLWSVDDPPQWFRDWYAANPGSIYHGPTDVSVPIHMKFQQNPVAWLRDGLLDHFIPMQYTIDDERWQREVTYFESFHRFVGADPVKMYMGIGWLDSKGFDAPGIVRRIKYGRTQGLKGFVIFILFNHDTDDAPLLGALSTDSAVNDFDAPFKTAAPPCLKRNN